MTKHGGKTKIFLEVFYVIWADSEFPEKSGHQICEIDREFFFISKVKSEVFHFQKFDHYFRGLWKPQERIFNGKNFLIFWNGFFHWQSLRNIVGIDSV